MNKKQALKIYNETIEKIQAYVLVLSTTDFIKAVAEQNNDALNKAIVTTVKRIVFAVMIFFLPILVDFILNILGLSCIVE